MSLLAKTAWVVCWEVMGNHNDVKDGQVVTVLSSRLGTEKATAALELLYKQYCLTLQERIRYRQPGRGPYKVFNPLRAHGIPVAGIQYSIGDNPMLTIRKVENLRQENEKIVWSEKGVAHPEWLCRDRGEPECPLKSKPPTVVTKSFAIP
jgi:hypothetical protein